MEHNSVIQYQVVGMDRLDNVTSSLPIEESIKILINSMIRNKGSIKYISIGNEENSISIEVNGDSVSKAFEIDYSLQLNNNKVVQALISITTGTEVIIIKDGVQREKYIDLKEINIGKIVEKKFKESLVGVNDEIIKFSFKKSELAPNGKGLVDDKKEKDIKSVIKSTYRELINSGVNINMFKDIIERHDIDGILINENDNIINGETKVFLYFMRNNEKGFEVIINDVKVEDEKIKELINWKREPLKRDGYTFTRLFISLVLEREEFNLNDYKNIYERVEILEKEIEKIIRRNSEKFVNPMVNINLEYNRERMEEIQLNLNEKYTTGVVKRLLDDYYEVNNK